MRLLLFCSFEFIFCMIGYHLDAIKKEFAYFMEMKRKGRRWLKYNPYALRDEMNSWKQDRRQTDVYYIETEKEITRCKGMMRLVV